MLDRIATGLMLRRWVLAAAGLGLVVMLAVATAPKPSCKSHVNQPPPMLVAECLGDAQLRADLKDALWSGNRPHTKYLLLIGLRQADCFRSLHAELEHELRLVSHDAAMWFLAEEDFDNAAAAMLTATSLGAVRADYLAN